MVLSIDFNPVLYLPIGLGIRQPVLKTGGARPAAGKYLEIKLNTDLANNGREKM